MLSYILLLVNAVGGVVLVAAGTFCLACGLYCAAEWLEDHARTSYKIITRYTAFCVALQLLWLASDRTALIPNLVGLASHANSCALLRRHPNHLLDQPPTILAAVLLISHQVAWLMWWNGSLTGFHQELTFGQIASLLGAIVWPVPAMLLLSSTGNESLPVSMPSAASGGLGRSLSQAGSLPLPQSPRSQAAASVLSMRRGSTSGGAATAATTAANGGSSSFGVGVSLAGDGGFHARQHKSLVVQGFDALKQLAHKHQLLPVTDADAEAPPGLMSKVLKDG